MRGMFTERFALPILLVVLIGGLLCGTYYIAGTHDSFVGTVRPALEVRSLSGIPTEIPVPFLQRHILILFSPTCPHCSTEIGHFAELVRSIPLVSCFGISFGSRSATDSLVRAHDVPFPVLLDRDGFVQTVFRINRVPVIVFVDEGDVIRLSLAGARSFQEDSLLYARFGRQSVPDDPGVGELEGMRSRTRPGALRPSFEYQEAPSACLAGGANTRTDPVGPRMSLGMVVQPDGPRQAVGLFTHTSTSFYKKEDSPCVPRS